jgi:16S rRNA (adenine1518-N6/adenine1519-N6)-dimethyltransferase
VIHKAKKSLGQNFLKSEPALRKIVETGEIKMDDVVLEIGPGKGALTKKLLEKAGVVIAVEKDYELFGFLKMKFEKEIADKKLILLNEDILEFNVNVKLSSKSYKLIANIPYNITGAILKNFLTEKNQPERMVLMVQHEVAKRIVARDGKESVLSISVKAYGEPSLIMKVPARYFSPAPKVDSAVILIKNISRKNFVIIPPPPLAPPPTLGGGGSRVSMDVTRHDFAKSEERFWEIVKAGFAHKRKKLSGNLKNVECQRDTLTELGNKRAEDLTMADWFKLAEKYNPS